MATRTTNTKRNILASYLLMGIQMIFSFVSKSVIVYTLGTDYLGLSSLFTSVLTVLNVAELGFTTSIVFFMYKPLAENDTVRVCALLAYLKKVYRGVGTAILLLGGITTFFLPLFIKGEVPQDINIYVLYILYLINTAISYFLSAHKTALLTAIQRLDLTKIANCIVMIIQYILQLLSLVVFKNYYLFVIAMIVGTGITNIFVAYISNKKFPQYECRGNITKEDKKEIINKVKGLLICNISIVTYSTLDSIVLSSFVGLVSVAIYNNYMTVYKAANQMIVLIRTAMQSSIGNSIASETVEKNLQDIYLWQFLFSVIATWCATAMICLYQPFMKLWMGNKLLLPMRDVSLIVIWFFVDIVQQSQNLYLAGAGLWNELRYSYIFNTCSNLILNIILGKLFGITGIIIASLVTCVISGTFWQCIIIFRNYFKTSARDYIYTQFKYFGIATFIVIISYILCDRINISGISGLMIKFLVSMSITTVLMFCFYHRNRWYDTSKKIVFNVLKMKKFEKSY